MFESKTYGGEPGLRVYEDEAGKPDKFDLDTSVYPHISPTALANYDKQAYTAGDTKYIDQTEVMALVLSPARRYEYSDSMIQAIVYHAGGMSMTVYPRERGGIALKVGRAARGVLMATPYKFVHHIVQADPRHASTHDPTYAVLSGTGASTSHDHFFKWPPSEITAGDWYSWPIST